MFKEQAGKRPITVNTYAVLRALSEVIEQPNSPYLAKLLRLVLAGNPLTIKEKGVCQLVCLSVCVCITQSRIKLQLASTSSPQGTEQDQLLDRLSEVEVEVDQALQGHSKYSPAYEMMTQSVKRCLECTVQQNNEKQQHWSHQLVRQALLGSKHNWSPLAVGYVSSTLMNLKLIQSHKLLAGGKLGECDFASGEALLINSAGETVRHFDYKAGELPEPWYTAELSKATVMRDLLAEQALKLAPLVKQLTKPDESAGSDCQQAIAAYSAYMKSRRAKVPEGQSPRTHRTTRFLGMGVGDTCEQKTTAAQRAIDFLRNNEVGQLGKPVRLPPGLFTQNLGAITAQYRRLFTPAGNRRV